MDFLMLAKQRYSVRSYEQTPVEQEKVQMILEAGRVAPTAVNKQPQHFIVVSSPDGLAKMKKGVNAHGAPLVIIICGDHSSVWTRPYDGKNMVDIDTTIVTDHMMMQAQALGLGSCWLTYFDPAVIREEFALPAHIEPVNILSIGYAKGAAASPERHATQRKPLESMVHVETF